MATKKVRRIKKMRSQAKRQIKTGYKKRTGKKWKGTGLPPM